MSTLVAKIINNIQESIQSKQLMAGEKLPSIRAQAKLWGVSTFTVGEAYDRLMLQGKIYSIQGKGYFVLPQANDTQAHTGQIPAPRPQALDETWLLNGIFQQNTPMLLAGCGWLPEHYYDTQLLQSALRQLAKTPQHFTEYGHPLGYAPLRVHLAHVLKQWHIQLNHDDILLTQGASQALNLVIQAYLQTGDTVLVDLPAYSNLISNLQAKGVNIIGVPWLATGPDLDALAAILQQHQPKIFFTNPTLHNPTGASYNAATTYQIASLAKKHQFLLVENQVSIGLAFHQPNPLSALDSFENTLFIGSFTKSLAPSLRVGFIAGQSRRILQLTHQKMLASLTSSSLNEQLSWHMLQDPKSQRQINGIKQKLSIAQAKVQTALLQQSWVLFATPQSGLFVYARHPNIGDAFEFANQQLQQGISLAPGMLFQLANQQKQAWFRFNVAFCDCPAFYNWLNTIGEM
jgi:DNA-binding transcriptional MocR family regulator